MTRCQILHLQYLLIIVVTVTTILALPTSKPIVKFDQRQDGNLNVRTDLQNIVVIIAPPPNGSLIDLLISGFFKGLSRKHQHRPHVAVVKNDDEQETQNFIESKTAPYHVDLTKRDGNGKNKIRPDVEKTQEVLVGRGKFDDTHDSHKELQRFARAYIVSIPNELDDEENEEIGIGKTSKIKEKLVLLGATLEQCGPDRRRDENGICRFINKQ
ncbi:uncharacterized protein [Onthophagus taurus]|uniref:uncharacterized protein n=1 Tax=Onthophagus taurus TaxID=166361 RepID=UPI000C20D949|nr:uncharacterized protein LOC111413386 [Onthophagus taurus]